MELQELKQHDKMVESIYNKIQLAKNQTSERTKEIIKDNINVRMERVFSQVFNIYTNPIASQQSKDLVKKQFSETLDIILMHSDKDVINALTNNLIAEKFKKKVLEN